MKKTINVNLGGVPFILDDDAFALLSRYLNEIEIRLDGTDDQETMQDIESRIADIFRNSITPQQEVVSIALIKKAISIIGPANEFGEPRRSLSDPSETTLSNGCKPRLLRSRTDKIIGGICGGFAQYVKVDPTLVRALTALAIILGGFGLLAYILCWIIIPLEPQHNRFNNLDPQ